MKNIFISLASILFLAVLISAQGKKNAEKIVLMEVGEGFHSNEIQARTGEKWLGLFAEKDHFYLAYTTVKILRVNDPVSDEDPKQKSGKAVLIDRKAKSYFLIKGFSTLQPGNVRTIFAGQQRLSSDNSFTLSFGQDKYSLNVLTKSKQKEALAGDATLVFTNGKITQTLSALHQSPETVTDDLWELIWAGDLDHDGHLDLYINHLLYNGEEKLLYVSSIAGKKQLVSEVARFAIVGC